MKISNVVDKSKDMTTDGQKPQQKAEKVLFFFARSMKFIRLNVPCHAAILSVT